MMLAFLTRNIVPIGFITLITLGITNHAIANKFIAEPMAVYYNWPYSISLVMSMIILFIGEVILGLIVYGTYRIAIKYKGANNNRERRRISMEDGGLPAPTNIPPRPPVRPPRNSRNNTVADAMGNLRDDLQDMQEAANNYGRTMQSSPEQIRRMEEINLRRLLQAAERERISGTDNKAHLELANEMHRLLNKPSNPLESEEDKTIEEPKQEGYRIQLILD